MIDAIFDPYGDVQQQRENDEYEYKRDQSIELAEIAKHEVDDAEQARRECILYDCFFEAINRHFDAGRLSEEEYQQELGLVIRGYDALGRMDDG